MESRQENLFKRIIATLACIIIFFILIFISYHLNSDLFQSFMNGTWLIPVASGILVLGVAGIWVTYFTEKFSSKRLINEINSRFYLQKVLIESGIKGLYFFEGAEQSEDEKTRFRDRFKSILKREKGEICVIAIAFRSCLHGGEIGFGFDEFKNACEDSKRSFKILLLHPLSEPAYTRGTHEHELYKTISQYKETKLYKHIIESCETILERKDKNSKIEARLYKVSPAFLDYSQLIVL